MSDKPSDLTIDYVPAGKNGTVILTARLAGEVIAVEQCSLTKSTARAKFAASLAEGRPGIAPEAVEAELLRIVAQRAGKPADQGPDWGSLAEIDVARIVRPERIITSAVSGLAIPTMAERDGKPRGQWVLYLRWADGKRERRALAPIIDLVDGERLWVHPQPSEPGAGTTAGWSKAAREAWLKGAMAPRPAEVFCTLCERIAYFLDLPADKAAGFTATLALWIILTYVYWAWPAVPYLFVGGSLGSGKSRLFEILARTAFRPLSTSSVTGPALFRTLHDRGGSLLLDEAERLRQAQAPEVQELLSMLLAGYKRGGQATRLEAVGETFRTIAFDVFGPKALACITGLPPALASRCIPLMMFRADQKSLKPRRRIDADPKIWQSLRDDLHAMALEHGPTWLALADRIDVCPQMSGRDFELWQPIVALAAFIEEHGASGLVAIVQQHSLETLADAHDETAPEADCTILRLLADWVLAGVSPTAKDLLADAQKDDHTTFKNWTPRTIQTRLKEYYVPKARKVAGGTRREYRDVTVGMLRQIQERYDMDLGLAETVLDAMSENLCPDQKREGNGKCATI